jgi:hypothetical protein
VIDRSALSMSSTVVVSTQQISCDVADEAVLLSMQTGEYYGLNPVGASIWRLIQQPQTVAGLVVALMDEYEGVTADACRDEVLSFLDEMIALELVEVV